MENLQPGTVIAQKYTVVQLLGRGGMGAVYAATHNVTGKRVAIKLLLPEFLTMPAAVSRFVREAQVAARIEHPNVVDVYDIGSDRGAHFLVMEFLDGVPFGLALEDGAVDLAAGARLLVDAMRGVDAAHRAGVVHRDIKPDNIFLCIDGDGAVRGVKVLDFGISKLTDGAVEAGGHLTQTGATMGTPHYMAPEQLRGARDIDGRADVYSFGVILYALVTGRLPFEADNFGALAMAVVTTPPPPIRWLRPDVPDALEALILRALAVEPSRRVPDVASLALGLEPFCAPTPVRLSAEFVANHRQRVPVAPLPRTPAPSVPPASASGATPALRAARPPLGPTTPQPVTPYPPPQVGATAATPAVDAVTAPPTSDSSSPSLGSPAADTLLPGPAAASRVRRRAVRWGVGMALVVAVGGAALWVSSGEGPRARVPAPPPAPAAARDGTPVGSTPALGGGARPSSRSAQDAAAPLAPPVAVGVAAPGETSADQATDDVAAGAVEPPAQPVGRPVGHPRARPPRRHRRASRSPRPAGIPPKARKERRASPPDARPAVERVGALGMDDF